jgi:hypothetical protein
MAIAALIISILALLTAGASALYTKQQAQAARQTTAIERERRHEERTPRFDARVESVSGWFRLWLRLDTTRPIARLTCRLVEADGITFGHSQNGVAPDAPAPIKEASWSETLEQGDSACWKVELEDEHQTDVRLRVQCRDQQGEEWQVTVPLSVPPKLPQVY